MKTKIIKVPYRREEGLQAIKDCKDLIEGFKMIHSINPKEGPENFTFSFLFCDFHPRDWTERVNTFLSAHSDSKNKSVLAINAVLNTLNKLHLEVLNHDS